VDVSALSLAEALNGSDPEAQAVFTEAYTPDTLIRLMQNEDPETIEFFRCNHMRRAIYRDDYKLINVGGVPDELFNVREDPGELHNLIDQEPKVVAELGARLETFFAEAEARRPADWEATRLRLEEDAELMERLRGLGYVE
jgi:arylsulfatase A-like enzyme